MNKPQYIELVSLIESYYPGRFKHDEQTAQNWWRILRDHEFKTCERNLMKHVQKSEFVPTIANLIAGAQDETRAYAQDLETAINSTPSIDDFVKDLERRTGKRVVVDDL